MILMRLQRSIGYPGDADTAVMGLCAHVHTTVPLHHGDFVNRLTITLPDDWYAMARSYAVANKVSLSKAIGDLLRCGRGPANPPMASGRQVGPKVHPETGFPLIDLKGGTTMADIQQAMDDEDVRHLEIVTGRSLMPGWPNSLAARAPSSPRWTTRSSCCGRNPPS